MAVQQLKLTRDQLASFLNDFEQVKQFEKLFSTVNEIDTVLIDEVRVDAGGAQATANEALAQIVQLSDKLNKEPASQANNSIATDYIDFDLNAPHVGKIARVAWNIGDQTLDIGMDYGVIQQVGQEIYARVGNTTGVTIPNGTVVGFAGATSSALLVSPYLANGATSSLYILGVMTHDLPDSGEKGYCCTWGFVRDVNTSAFTAGDILYASPSVAGGLTNVKPTAPDNVIPVASCIVSNATTGVIFVRPTIEQQKYYAEFSKTGTVSPAVINTSYAISWDNVEIANGITIVSGSQITVSESGLYQFNTTLQLSSGSSSAKNVLFWFKKNGNNIANTTRATTTDINNGYTPISLSEFFSLDAGDYIEMWWQADSTNVSLVTIAAGGVAPDDYPAAPAGLVSITQVQQ